MTLRAECHGVIPRMVQFNESTAFCDLYENARARKNAKNTLFKDMV